jgi:membrane protease YdiL (CAAX protease family)
MAIFASAVPLAKSLPKPWSEIVPIAMAALVTSGLTIIFVRWEKLKPKDVGILPDKNSFSMAFIGFVVGLLMPCLQVALVMLTGHVKLIIVQDITLRAVLLTLLLHLLLSWREEFAFRAYPLRSLNYSYGPWAALSIIAVMFGTEHVIAGSSLMDGFLGASVGSILYGIAALKTKGVAFPIGIHAAWNFGQWILGFKGEPGIWKVVIHQEDKKSIDTIGWMIYLLVIGVGIASVYFYWKSPLKDSVTNSGQQSNRW